MSRRDFIVVLAVVLVGVGGCAKVREGVESMAGLKS